MKLAIDGRLQDFVHDDCRTPSLSDAPAKYQRVGIEIGRRSLIGRRVTVEGDVRQLVKQFDEPTGTYTIQAVVDFPCVKCGTSSAKSVSLGQLTVASLVGDLRCQSCGRPLEMISSEHSQAELQSDLDRVSLTAAFACRNPGCLKQRFAIKALNVRVQALIDRLGGPSTESVADITEVSDVTKMIEALVHQKEPGEFRSSFENIAAAVGRIDENLLKAVEKQSGRGWIEATPDEVSRSLRYLGDILKEGLGGAVGHAAGTFLYELLKHLAMSG